MHSNAEDEAKVGDIILETPIFGCVDALSSPSTGLTFGSAWSAAAETAKSAQSIPVFGGGLASSPGLALGATASTSSEQQVKAVGGALPWGTKFGPSIAPAGPANTAASVKPSADFVFGVKGNATGGDSSVLMGVSLQAMNINLCSLD